MVAMATHTARVWCDLVAIPGVHIITTVLHFSSEEVDTHNEVTVLSD